MLLHETQIPGQALATFTAGRSGAGATASRFLKNAVVETISSSLIGCTTKHSYRITGGVMSTSPA
jgi:hypothetical protein